MKKLRIVIAVLVMVALGAAAVYFEERITAKDVLQVVTIAALFGFVAIAVAYAVWYLKQWVRL